jgi:hypothetical protein
MGTVFADPGQGAKQDKERKETHGDPANQSGRPDRI